MPARNFSLAIFRSFSLSSSLQRLLFGTTKARCWRSFFCRLAIFGCGVVRMSTLISQPIMSHHLGTNDECHRPLLLRPYYFSFTFLSNENIYCPICLCCIRVLPSSSQETLQGQSYRYEPLLLLHRAYRTFDQRWWNLVHLCELRISVDWVYHDNHFDYIHLKTVTKSDLMDVELARDGEISNGTQGNGYR